MCAGSSDIRLYCLRNIIVCLKKITNAHLFWIREFLCEIHIYELALLLTYCSRVAASCGICIRISARNRFCMFPWEWDIFPQSKVLVMLTPALIYDQTKFHQSTSRTSSVTRPQEDDKNFKELCLISESTTSALPLQFSKKYSLYR